MKPASRSEAQAKADRIRVFSDELQTPELASVLSLTPEQHARFDAWSGDALRSLAAQFDVDTTSAQKQMSWGMRIASTLGGLAICAAIVLFFTSYWGYLETPVQVLILMLLPLLALAGTEYAARRERTLYFAGLLALVSLAAFVLNLHTVGSIFNIASTENALLAWGVFALLLACRYGLRLMLTISLLLLISYTAATLTARLGYQWFDFGERPEALAVFGLMVFAVPFALHHPRNADFPPVYRLVGALTFFFAVLSLAEWGLQSYLPLEPKTVERLYEMFGLASSAAAIWLGITRQWNGIANTGSAFFVLFLFCRLYHWWWDWMPQYLFFAIIGMIAIGLVMVFKRLRTAMERAMEGRLEA